MPASTHCRSLCPAARALSPADLLLIAILATLTGQTQVRASAHCAALRTTELAGVFRFLRAPMPHPVPWSRVLGSAVDGVALQPVVRDTMYAPSAAKPKRASSALAIDGKTVTQRVPGHDPAGPHPGRPVACGLSAD